MVTYKEGDIRLSLYQLILFVLLCCLFTLKGTCICMDKEIEIIKGDRNLSLLKNVLILEKAPS